MKTPSENTPRTVIEECESGDSGSTKDFVVTIVPSLYEQMQNSDYVPLEDETIFAKCKTDLGDCVIQDEFVDRFFGTCMVDFKFLCQTTSRDYPDGMVVFNVDRERATLFAYDFYYEPQYVGCHEALEWYKRSEGNAIGLVVSKAYQDKKVMCELFEILKDDEDFDPMPKIDYLLSSFRVWECAKE